MARKTIMVLFSLLMVFPAARSVLYAQTTPIPGNVPGFTLSGASPATPTNTLQMSIRLAWQNPAGLQTLLTNLQTPGNSQFHKFLSNAAFLTTYAPSPTLVQGLISWLQSQGFTVQPYSSPGMFIDFSGTVAQAQTAFQTSIVSATLGGQDFYENTVTPSLPTAYAGTVVYIDGLNNLADASSVSPTPGPTPTPGPPVTNFFKPSDLYTYYNATPVLNGGNQGTTSNDCIAIIAESDFSNNAFTTFANTYNLPTTLPTRRLVNLTQPLSQNSNGEVSLDTEWSHAVAPNTPQMVYEYNTGIALGLMKGFDAMVNDDACGVLSSSIGPGCAQDVALFVAYDQVFQQAAAQGQSVFQAAGDKGAAGESLLQASSQLVCAVGGSGARHVSEIATSPDLTAVGGTMFSPVYNSSGNDTSVIGQIVESVWDAPDGTAGGAGGVSSVFALPTWQQSVQAQLKAPSNRLFPDVALGASASMPGFYTYEIDANGNQFRAVEGGTSIATPMWAGLSRLVAKAIANPRVGNIDPILYAQSNGGTSIPGIVDITTGNNTVVGVTGYSAMAGYDLVSGWGVPNIAVLVPDFGQALSPGAQATGSNAQASGVPGQTVTAGTLTITNTVGAPEALSQVSVQAAVPQLIASLALSAAVGSTSFNGVAAVTPTGTTFTFNPAVGIPAGGSAVFTLTATLKNPLVVSARQPIYAALIPGAAADYRGLCALGLGLAMIGLGLGAAPRRRRLWLLGLLLIVFAVTEVGCGSNGGSNPSYGSTSLIAPPNGVSISNTTTSGIVGVTNLPVSIGVVSVF